MATELSFSAPAIALRPLIKKHLVVRCVLRHHSVFNCLWSGKCWRSSELCTEISPFYASRASDAQSDWNNKSDCVRFDLIAAETGFGFICSKRFRLPFEERIAFLRRY